jgi:hypothetical protein
MWDREKSAQFFSSISPNDSLFCVECGKAKVRRMSSEVS